MTSFLLELAPKTYDFLDELRPIALKYSIVLVVVFILSLFLQWNILLFLINLMMGWSILSILFVGVIITLLDPKFIVEESQYKLNLHHKEISYKLSAIWGIILCISGLIALYYSDTYRKFYNFQCQNFYLDRTVGVYHIYDDCDYIGFDEDNDIVYVPDIVKLNGKELINTNNELCVACESRAQDAEFSSFFDRWYRRP